MAKFLLLLVAMVSVSNCRFGGYTFPSYARTYLGDSVDVASMKLLKETYNDGDDKNIVASPLGVLTLLSLYASGAEGKNQEEIMKYLGAPEYKVLVDSYSELSERFASMDPSFLTVANKVYVSNKYTLREQFKNVARSYHSEVDNIDFADQKTTAKVINEWASKNTKGKIDHPVSEGQIDAEAAVALLNIIFFQGHWHVPFNASETQDKEFHVGKSKSVQKPMMHLLQSLFYKESDTLGARLLELPYKETKFRMIIVLPNEIDGLEDVLKKVAQNGLLEDVFSMHPAGADVDLDMPKFEIKSKLELNDILTKVGVKRMFEESALGVVVERGVAVSSVFQEAFVKVDEEGATAGAFTGLVAVPMSWPPPPPPEPISFKVDRPFLFAILHDDIVLFAGTYTH